MYGSTEATWAVEDDLTAERRKVASALRALKKIRSRVPRDSVEFDIAQNAIYRIEAKPKQEKSK